MNSTKSTSSNTHPASLQRDPRANQNRGIGWDNTSSTVNNDDDDDVEDRKECWSGAMENADVRKYSKCREEGSLSLSTASYQFIWYTSVVAAAVAIFFFVHDKILRLFIFLLLFRYVRLIVNQAAFCLYKPVAVPAKPTLTAKDVRVIVPTVEPDGEQFEECQKFMSVSYSRASRFWL